MRDLSSKETLGPCRKLFNCRSGLRKLWSRITGVKLRWPLYMALSSVVLIGFLVIHNYYFNHFYVVRMDEQEVGLVRDAGELDLFLEDLIEQCSALYGMEVMPAQEITMTLEYRPGEDADPDQAMAALRNRINLITEAVMVMVDGNPVIPVYTYQEIDTVIKLISTAYVSKDSGVKLLEVEVVEEIYGEGCIVAPEQVYEPAEVAALLTGQGRHQELFADSREVLMSRSGADALGEPGADLPVVHVITVEEITVGERIPYTTTYTNTNNLFVGQSRVATTGKDGRREVTYRVTRENGIETARESTAQKVTDKPVDRVIERGVARRFIWPVAGGGRLSQYFRGSAHRGIDIAAPTGTPVLAADSGVVVRSEYRGAMGNYIIIKHSGYWTVYLHHSRNLVWAGQRVSRGQTIAYVGSTGNSTGPHLHFEIRRCNGSGVWTSWTAHTAINPLQFW